MARHLMYAASMALFLCLASLATADDPGYFLSWQQKKDLMRLGRIQDSAGTWYDVWICPGYSPPARYAKAHLMEAGRDFHEYIEANKYQSLKAGSKACFNWALQECGLGFTVRGIPRAWGRYFSVAHERTKRRVFGWWLAYPWALMESTVESAFRGALGAAGTAGGIASGLAVVPAYHALDSAVAGTWNLGVNTFALPIAGVAWNTAVSPPLALVGQKPSQSRVDGFWVTIVDSGRVPIARPPSPEDAALLSQWGLLLLRETQPFEKERQAIDQKANAQEQEYQRALQAARNDAERQRTRLQTEECTRIQLAMSTNAWIATVLEQQPDLRYDWTCNTDISRHLQKQGVSVDDIQRILDLLRTYQSPHALAPSSIRSKTDPLRRGVEVIGESAVDVLDEAAP